MREQISLAGRLRIVLREPDGGRVVREHEVDNLVTLVGRKLLAEMLTGASGFKAMSIAVGGPANPGDSTPTPALTDTALANKLAAVEAEIGPTAAQPVDEQTRMVTTISGTLDADLDGTGEDLPMTEAGIVVTKIDDTTVLYNRVVFKTITKQAHLQMTLTWEVLF